MMIIGLDKLVRSFNPFLWKVALHLYEIVLNNQNHLLVLIAKIVEVGEKADLVVAKLKGHDEHFGKHQTKGGSARRCPN